jgi:hypothetical protein
MNEGKCLITEVLLRRYHEARDAKLGTVPPRQDGVSEARALWHDLREAGYEPERISLERRG